MSLRCLLGIHDMQRHGDFGGDGWPLRGYLLTWEKKCTRCSHTTKHEYYDHAKRHRELEDERLERIIRRATR